MKCESCRAGWETNNENGYEGGCHLEGFIDISDKIEYTDDGCTIHHKTLKKLMDEHDEWDLANKMSYVDWYIEREKIRETCVICGIEKRGTDTTTCDSDHNTVSEPCGQIVCYQCWEKQRSDSIYHGKVPDCCIKAKQQPTDGEGK